jgi:H+/Cl- antiporter ClcA
MLAAGPPTVTRRYCSGNVCPTHLEAKVSTGGRYDSLVSPTAPSRAPWILRLVIVTALVGVGAGVGGLCAALLFRLVGTIAYGVSSDSFLDDVLQADPSRRMIALCAAGVFAAFAWWALRRWGAPIVSVEASVAGKRMPWIVSILNAAIQIIIVGLGASIGKEVAPRELGALVAGWLTDKAGVTARERRILVACGAGAGLAAVYNVPLGGAVLAVEVLLAEISFATVLPALATSAIAALVARLVVPTTPLYHLPQFTLSPTIVIWSVIIGPVLGFAAVGFVWLIKLAQSRRPRGWGILVAMPLVFAGVGLLSLAFPSILGNGQALGQVAFAGLVGVPLITVLLLLKMVATTATIGSGGAGGTLQPSVAIGAALGAATGGLWLMLWPGSPVAAFAFIAAAAFLASTMRAPLTALVLLIEFTGQGPALLIPAILAIGGSVAVSYVIGRRRLVDAA